MAGTTVFTGRATEVTTVANEEETMLGATVHVVVMAPPTLCVVVVKTACVVTGSELMTNAGTPPCANDDMIG